MFLKLVEAILLSNFNKASYNKGDNCFKIPVYNYDAFLR